MSEGDDGEHIDEDKVPYVEGHLLKHSDVVACLPEYAEEVQEPEPHYDRGERVNSAYHFSPLRVVLVPNQGRVVHFKTANHYLCDDDGDEDRNVHIVPDVRKIRLDARNYSLPNFHHHEVSDADPYKNTEDSRPSDFVFGNDCVIILIVIGRVHNEDDHEEHVGHELENNDALHNVLPLDLNQCLH